MITQFLLLLVLIPLSTHYLANMHNPDLKWRLTGISFGLVIAPVSFCLLKYTYVPILGKLMGFVGLSFNLIHGSIGYFIVMGLGFQDPSMMLTASELTIINVINGAIWGVFYGILGYNIDEKLAIEAGEREMIHGHGGYKPAVAHKR